MLLLLSVTVVSGWMFITWLVCLAGREARRQKLDSVTRSEMANKEGGVALVLATELHDR